MSYILAEDEQRKKSGTWLIIFLVLGVAISYFGLRATLAANVTINSGQKIEFGQGLAQTTSCSGSQSLVITPISTFTNAGGSTGSFKFSSFKVSNIPSSCDGYDYTINVYDSVTSSSPLSIFNTSSTSAVIYDTGTSFSAGVGSSGMSVTVNSSSSFTATFATPVAIAGSIYKLTIQSSPHTLVCIEGANCSIGDTGPGGGVIFYVNSGGFTCGPTLNLTCNYLEAAPAGWGNGANDWSLTASNVSYQSTSIGANAQGTAIGTGLRNTNAFVSQGNDASTLSGKARAYTGGGKSDWYIPSSLELAELWTQRSIIGNYAVNTYASSTETSATTISVKSFGSGGNVDTGGLKSTNYAGRAIRAF